MFDIIESKQSNFLLPPGILYINHNYHLSKSLVEIFPFNEGLDRVIHGIRNNHIVGTFEGSPSWAIENTGRRSVDFRGNTFDDKIDFGNTKPFWDPSWLSTKYKSYEPPVAEELMGTTK